MNNPDKALKRHLECNVTTICYVWIVERRDGEKLGFTDHDNVINVDDVICDPQSGFTAGAIENAIGFSGDTNEVTGALTSDKISAYDLDAHLYDGASVVQWLVNWANPSEKTAIRRYYVGEITREQNLFRVELRSYSASLEQVRGRYYTRHCDADLGDVKCGVDLQNSKFRLKGVVASEPAPSFQSIFTTINADFTTTWFSLGKLQFISGDMKGQNFTIASIQEGTLPEQIRISILESFPLKPKIEDAFTITAGCDKNFFTCKEKFSNGINFRGFPHMPGNEKALNYLDRENELDGGPLVP